MRFYSLCVVVVGDLRLFFNPAEGRRVDRVNRVDGIASLDGRDGGASLDGRDWALCLMEETIK